MLEMEGKLFVELREQVALYAAAGTDDSRGHRGA